MGRKLMGTQNTKFFWILLISGLPLIVNRRGDINCGSYHRINFLFDSCDDVIRKQTFLKLLSSAFKIYLRHILFYFLNFFIYN